MDDTKTKLNQIRMLLEEVKKEIEPDEQRLFAHNFDALELSSIVTSIVDYLQPLLHPYKAAIYWYLFRRSILAAGQQYACASTKGMQRGIIQSSSGQSATLSYSAVQQALAGLEQKAIITKVGEPNRDGTLYKVNLPEEISICQEFVAKNNPAGVVRVDESKELDFYNVSENRLRIFERDDYRCHYCQKQLTRFTATLDHIQPVFKGGDNAYDNLVTACLHCNSRRGNRAVMDMYVEQNSSVKSLTKA